MGTRSREATDVSNTEPLCEFNLSQFSRCTDSCEIRSVNTIHLLASRKPHFATLFDARDFFHFREIFIGHD